MGSIESIYLALPKSFQSVLINIEGYRLNQNRYGGNYQEIFENYQEQLRFDKKELREYQNTRLSLILEYASKIEFWRERFDQYGVNKDGLDKLYELSKLPVLTKLEVQENISGFENGKDPFKGEIQTIHTSGTTGSGLYFWRTKEAEKIQWAVWWRYRKFHGIDRATWCGYFGGRQIIKSKASGHDVFRINKTGKQILFSGYHLNKKTVENYRKAIIKYKVSWIHGYPSMITLFANFILQDTNNTIESVRNITFGSESLLSHQRNSIQQAFPNAKLTDHYGHAEGVVNLSQRDSDLYIVDEDFSIVEFLPEPTGNLRMIGTTLTNPAFPLLRYDSGDIAQGLSEDKNGWRTIESIDGRKEDYVLLPDGTKLGRMDHIFKNMTEIKEAQIVQNSTDEIEIHVVWFDSNSPAHEKLMREAKKRIGERIRIKLVDKLELSKSSTGKLRLVLNNLKDDEIS